MQTFFIRPTLSWILSRAFATLLVSMEFIKTHVTAPVSKLVIDRYGNFHLIDTDTDTDMLIITYTNTDTDTDMKKTNSPIPIPIRRITNSPIPMPIPI